MIGQRYRELADEVSSLSGGSTRILLAAKHQSPENIAAALEAGATLLGHNIIQQLVSTENALSGAPAHDTHVIGPVQSNKVRDATRYADVIESVDRMKIAARIEMMAEANNTVQDIFLQVNSAGADTQGGLPPSEVLAFADMVSADLPHVRVTGLMTIGAHTDDQSLIHASFETTRELRDKLRASGHTHCTELSMGMSGDYRIAIEHGATIVRLGRTIFGDRPAT